MYNLILDEITSRFLYVIEHAENSILLTTEDFGWNNFRYKSDLFRMAHVERYADEKIDVLHVTTFPHHWSPEPIFGFDVIVSNKQPIGAYLDFSPVCTNVKFEEGIQWAEKKDKPEWATVFSDEFILIKPESEVELNKFCEFALKKYDWYVNTILRTKEKGNVNKIIEKQNNYCEVQSQNPRTFSVLKNKIGEQSAKYFMESILFPKIKKY
jgi:hypothetical protein